MKWNPSKPFLITIVVLIFAIVVIEVLFSYSAMEMASSDKTILVTANIIDTIEHATNLDANDWERDFDPPILVNWDVKILGCLASCEGYSFQNLDSKVEYEYFQGYDDLLDKKFPDLLDLRDKTFHLKGEMTGIDCSYKDTVFGGQCTPQVKIFSMEQFPKSSVDWFKEERIKVGENDYILTAWGSVGNRAATVEFALWDIGKDSKEYSVYAAYNFRPFNDERICDNLRYSVGDDIDEVEQGMGQFFENKLIDFQKEHQWPKECLGIE